jgi:hypothetical protein
VRLKFLNEVKKNLLVEQSREAEGIIIRCVQRNLGLPNTRDPGVHTRDYFADENIINNFYGNQNHWKEA